MVKVTNAIGGNLDEMLSGSPCLEMLNGESKSDDELLSFGRTFTSLSNKLKMDFFFISNW